MKLNKLLQRQLKKTFPDGIPSDTAFRKLVIAVNNSYNSYERDSLLSKHTFDLTENEYLQVNNKLIKELELKQQTLENLNELVREVTGDHTLQSDGEIPAVISYLKKEMDLRIRAEEKLSTAAQRLYSLIVHMQNGILVEDENRHILLSNQYFCDLFHIPASPEQLTGQDCSDSAELTKHLFKNPGAFVERINQLVHEKLPAVNDELELTDGRFFSRDFIPIYEGDEYRGHYWKYTDITEQKNSFRKIEEEEEKNRLIMNGALDSIITMDLSGKITFWNSQAEKTFGYSAAEAMGKTMNDLIIPERYREDHSRGMKHYIATGEAIVLNRKMEMTALRKSGAEFPIEISIISVRQSGTELFCAFIRDITERKESEENLRMTSHVASLNRNGVLFADMDGHINWCNTGFCNQTGYHYKEVIGRTPVELLRGEKTDVTALRSLLLKFYTGENFTEEMIAYRRDGSWFWAKISGQYIREEDGHISRYFAVIEDITLMKEAQDRILHFNNQFRKALEKIGDNVWEHDFQSDVTVFSRRTAQILGFRRPSDRKLAKFWRDHIHPDDKHLVDESDRKYRAGEQDHHILEYRLNDKEGSEYWVLDRGVVIERDEQGLPRRIIGTHTNITERKLAEQKLRINEEKYRNIIANMNLGLLEVDQQEIIQFANQSFCDMSGFEYEDLIGQQASRLFVRGDGKKHVDRKNQLRETGISDAYELPVQNKRGELRWWLVSGAPRYNDQGEYAGSVGIHLDITEQKTLQIELSEAREAAEQSARSKEIFLANMSHEIRTPMNAILGMTHQMQKTTLDERQRFFLNTINTAGEHLLVVINDILDISKIEAGKLHVEEIPFDPVETMRHAIQVMQHRAQEKGLTLEFVPDSHIAPVLIGDPHRINQILLNLISNAVKFTEKGHVRLYSKLMMQETGRQLVRFTVEDTGIGMSEKFKKNLFHTFSQEDKTAARKYGGTGLGMAISKQLVELMGGHIHVESEKGKGTVVELTIAFRTGRKEDVHVETERIVPTEVLNGKRLLLVEDNELNRLVATTILQQYHVQVTEAENGKIAIDSLRSNTYDLILMDMQMPVMDGLEATRLIRKEFSKQIPIVALTANAVKGENERCIEAGMNDYLVKPFREEDLVHMITHWLQHTDQIKPRHPERLQSADLYDLSVIERISNDNEEFVWKMVRLFIDQLPPAVEEIKKAFASGDMHLVKALSHRSKPSIDNMGIRKLHTVIRDIEQYAMQNPGHPALAENIQVLDETISLVVEKLREQVLSGSKG